jgi:deoxyribonuclease-1
MIRVILTIAVTSLLAACEPLDTQATTANKPVSSQGERDYAQARSQFWRHVYPQDGVTLYCQQAFQSSSRRGINIEHVFPMSWATSALKCGKRKQCRVNSVEFNIIESDMHNLFPSRSDVNQARSSFRFGEVRGEKRDYGRHCDFEINSRARVAEPTPAVRGEVARAMFYMAHEYQGQGLLIFKKQARLLMAWHRADPPSGAERRRNDIIAKIQGNRNPFIDRPEYLEELYRAGHFDGGR